MPLRKRSKNTAPLEMDSQDYRLGGGGENDSPLVRAQRRVETAQKWRSDAKYDETWAKLIKLYGNRYEYPELSQYQDIIAPNMLFSTANVIVPSVSVNYPKISVTARKPYDEQRSTVVEAVANYEWQHGDVHEEFGLAVKDFVILGHGWCKATWTFIEEERDLTDEEFQEQAVAALIGLQEEMENAQALGMPLDDFPTPQEKVDSLPGTTMFVKEDRALVERVSPFDMFVDPDATRLKNALWIAQRIYMPIEKAKSREDWNVSARNKLKGVSMKEAKSNIDLMFDGEERGSNSDHAIIWEYYDLVNGTVCTFAEGCDEYLIDPTPVDTPFSHPFVMLRNYDIPDKFYPLGDVEAIGPLQMELALTRTQMVNDRKRYRRMYLVREESLGEDGMAALQSGDDNAIISVTGDTHDFGEVIAPIATTSLPPEFYNQTAMILDDMRLVSGVTEYQNGQVPEIRRTATEASMIQDGANARSAAKLAIIERGIGEVAERVVQLAQQFLSTDQVARIVGPNDSPMWINYTREDLRGEYDFSVEAGSTMPQNESSRRQSAMQLMDAMAPFVGTAVSPQKLAEYVLRQGFGIKNPQDFMIPPEQLMAAGIDPVTGQPLPPPPMTGEAPPPAA